MEITDFGVPVDVQAPPADQTDGSVLAHRRQRLTRGGTVVRHGPGGTVGRVGRAPPLLPRRPRRAPSATRRPGSASSTRCSRSSTTATRRCCSRCSATRPTSASWRSGPTSPGSRRSSTSCSARPLELGRLVRVAHRAVGVHRDRGRRAGPAGRRGGPRRRRRLEARLAAWRERIEHYREQRIHPQLPLKQTICFYPMSKRRGDGGELVRAAVRGAQGAHGRPRARRPHLRRPRAAADHRLDRARRLGVGRHAARRRPGRAEGDRLRDALRPGVGRLRRVRSVLHRAACSSPPRRCARVGL